MEEIARNIFLASVNAVKPCELMTVNKLVQLHKDNGKSFIEIKCNGKIDRFEVTNKNLHLVGFGKGVLALAAELVKILDFNSGIISVPVGAVKQQNFKCANIKVIEGAAGNLPDKNSLKAAKEIKFLVNQLKSDDILFCLITGGGSALLPLPTYPITLDEKTQLIKSLSKAGATINELNTVRIAISDVKGGKLAELGRNCDKIISLIISDIINDPLELIASGPTMAYQKPEISPREILERYNLTSTLPESIAKVIKKNEENQDAPMMIKNSKVFLIGNNRIAIDAAMNEARNYNFIPVFLSAQVQGDVVDVSRAFFELANVIQQYSTQSINDFKRSLESCTKLLNAQDDFAINLLDALKASTNGICIISGGETTVIVHGDGLGGRNQELALRFTKLCHDAKIPSSDDLLFLSAGTDGIDANNNAAGAMGGSRILSALIDSNNSEAKSNISQIMQEFILRNDSYNFYKKQLDKYAGERYQIIIGHTGTNVMDIHVLMMKTTTKKND